MVVGDFTSKVDTLVIGSGPGGYVAAIRAAQLGKSVVIVEKSKIGGVCLNEGCIPSKALINVGATYRQSQLETPFGIKYNDVSLNFDELQEWKNNSVITPLTQGVESLLKKNNVQIIQGEAFFTSDRSVHVMREDNSGESFEFNNAIISTGSRPIEIPNFKYGKRILDSTGLLNIKELPKTLTVVGGGYIGMELAMAYASMGTKVTILEGTSTVLSAFEKDIVQPVLKKASELNIDIITSVKADKAQESEDSVNVTYIQDGKEITVESEYVAVVVGRRPNTDNLSLELAGVAVDEKGYIDVDVQCRTNKENIFAIGDIVRGPALAHKASYEGKVAAEVIAGKNESIVDYQVIPTVCFTYPEIAVVGLTKEQAKEKGFETKVAKFNFQSNGRALSLNAKEGFVRLISDAKTNRILGAQLVGHEVSELVGEITLAIEHLLTAEDLVLTIHNHPSLSETILDASEILLGQGIHQ